MFKTLAATAALACAGTFVSAQDFILHNTEDSFAEVAFAVENAILSKGLVIDSVSHVGDMLERTKADVGATQTIFTKADVFLFCSATVSRRVMEDDPMNIQFCPYGISVFESPETPGTVTVGYRAYPEGAMQEVQDLLHSIVTDALMLE